MLNQSYNAGLNYYNRNATSVSTDIDLIMSYFGAISASLLIMYASKRQLSKLGMDQNKGIGWALTLGINVCATSSAGALNACMMRWKESQGIKVFDKDMNEVGVSSKAGVETLKSMAISRMALSCCCLSIPMFLVSVVSITKFYNRSNVVKNVLDAGFVATGLTLGLPISVALFDNQLKI